MLTKEEHINYWIDTAKRDWKTVNNLFGTKDYMPALFFSHLHLEKLCKALWIKNNESNHPPKVHNLIKILEEAKIQVTPEQKDFMTIMNGFQLEGRYPDYLNRLYKMYKKKKTSDILENFKNIKFMAPEQLLNK